MKTTTKTKLKFADLPKDYAGLCQLLLPRTIHDQAEYDNACDVVLAMCTWDKHFTPDQEDYFELLNHLVLEYQDKHEKPRKQPTGLESLKHLLAENNMNASDLARLLGVHRSLGSMILNGERQLTVAHIKILAKRFCVSGNLFL